MRKKNNIKSKFISTDIDAFLFTEPTFERRTKRFLSITLPRVEAMSACRLLFQESNLPRSFNDSDISQYIIIISSYHKVTASSFTANRFLFYLVPYHYIIDLYHEIPQLLSIMAYCFLFLSNYLFYFFILPLFLLMFRALRAIIIFEVCSLSRLRFLEA